MRPILRRRRMWGITSLAASALFGLLTTGRPALASSCETEPTVHPYGLIADDEGDDDEAFQKQVKQVEQGLNILLTVDEDKKVHVKKEFRDSLPMPAENIERMLQMTVKVGDDGKLHLRNPEQIRPFLPQIEKFLKSAGGPDKMKERLKQLEGKSPEERRAAIEKMMREGELPRLGERPDDKKKGDDKRKVEKKPEEKRVEKKRVVIVPDPEPRDERRERRGDERPAPPSANPRLDIMERLARIERRLEHLTQMLERIEREHRGGHGDEQRRLFLFRQGPEGRPGAQGERRWQAEPWGWRAEPREHGDRDERRAPRAHERDERRPERRHHEDDDRDEDEDEGRERRRGGREGGPREFFDRMRKELERRGRELPRMFERERDERREPRRHHDDQDERDGEGDLFSGEAMKDVVAGLKKVQSTLTPEDWARVRKLIERLRTEIKPEDLKDRDGLMLKIQGAVDPEDMPRFLEIVGEVLGSPEGRGLQKRGEQAMRRFERFVQSDEAKRLEERFSGVLKGDQGKKVKGAIDKLFRPGQQEEKRPAEKKHDAPRRSAVLPTNPNAKLY